MAATVQILIDQPNQLQQPQPQRVVRIGDLADEIIHGRHVLRMLRSLVVVSLGILGFSTAMAVIGFAFAVTATVSLLGLFEPTGVNNYLMFALVTGVLLLCLFTTELLASMAWNDIRSYYPPDVADSDGRLQSGSLPLSPVNSSLLSSTSSLRF